MQTLLQMQSLAKMILKIAQREKSTFRSQMCTRTQIFRCPFSGYPYTKRLAQSTGGRLTFVHRYHQQAIRRDGEPMDVLSVLKWIRE